MKTWANYITCSVAPWQQKYDPCCYFQRQPVRSGCCISVCPCGLLTLSPNESLCWILHVHLLLCVCVRVHAGHVDSGDFEHQANAHIGYQCSRCELNKMFQHYVRALRYWKDWLPHLMQQLGKARLLTADPVKTALIEADNSVSADSNSQLNVLPSIGIHWDRQALNLAAQWGVQYPRSAQLAQQTALVLYWKGNLLKRYCWHGWVVKMHGYWKTEHLRSNRKEQQACLKTGRWLTC